MDDLTAPDRLTARRLSARPVISDRAILCLILAIGMVLLVGITREQWSQWVTVEPTVLYQCVGPEGSYYQRTSCPHPIQYEVVRTIYDCQTPDNHWQQSSPCPVWRETGGFANQDLLHPATSVGCDDTIGQSGAAGLPCRHRPDDHGLSARRKSMADAAPIEVTLRPGANLDPCAGSRAAQLDNFAPSSTTGPDDNGLAATRSSEMLSRTARVICTN